MVYRIPRGGVPGRRHAGGFFHSARRLSTGEIDIEISVPKNDEVEISETTESPRFAIRSTEEQRGEHRRGDGSTMSRRSCWFGVVGKIDKAGQERRTVAAKSENTI